MKQESNEATIKNNKLQIFYIPENNSSRNSTTDKSFIPSPTE